MKKCGKQNTMIIFRRFVDSAERKSENCCEMCAINFQCDNDLIELYGL